MNASNPRIHCPQCGSLIPDVQIPSALDPHDEISLIQKETRRLDSLIYEAKQKRVALHRRLNAIQSSTRNIPYEILSSIFRHATPSFTNFHAQTSFPDAFQTQQTQINGDARLPMTLASVSSVWRNTALSIPEIWKNLDLTVSRMDRIPFAAALIDFYLKNADSYPFSLNLIFGQALSSYEGTDYPLRPLENVIFGQGHAEKYESLHISPYPASWPPFLSSVPNIVNLSLKGSPFRNGVQALVLEEHKFLSLRHLALQQILPSTSLSTQLWKNLTVLVADRIPLHFCLSVFTLCPLLREYRVRPPALGFTTSDDSFFPEDVTMEYLQVLEWDFSRMLPNSAMLTRLRLPVLSTLGLGSPRNLHLQQQLCSFVSRLPSTLNFLELTHCDYNSLPFTYWYSLLASLHGVQKLTLRLSFMNSLYNILAVLGSRSILTNVNVLPRLEEIIVEDEKLYTSSHHNTAVFGPAILTHLVDVLEHREKIRKCTLHLNRRLVCDDSAQYRLNKLRTGGLNLDIGESGIISTFLPIM